MDLVDIGANLAHDSFDPDRNEVIERAAGAGVRRLVVTGSSERSSADAAALAQRRPGRLFATAGVHPHHASEYTAQAHEVLRDLSSRDGVVAIGECGLDYFRDFSPRAAQRDAFEAQLELAATSRLPVFLHQREAHADFVAILKPVMGKLTGGVAHCFTGDAVALRAYLDMGLYIGITGWICDDRRGEELRRLAPDIPAERLMIETDAPYLLPRTLVPRPRTRRNEPMYLREVLRVLADVRGEPEEFVASVTTANAVGFFGLDVRQGATGAESR